MEFLLRYRPANGIVDSEHELHLARGAELVGEPSDATEATRLEWVPLADIPQLIVNRELVSGASLVGLLYVRSGAVASPS